MIGTILLFLVLLSVLVLAHEWGHFAAARKAGMVVEEFGIGFPPRVLSFKSRKGTVWSINLIPLGGFVRIQGESGEKRFEAGSFATKGYFARFAVLFGGVFMNLVVASLLFTIGFAFGLPSVIEGGVDAQAIVSNEAINVVQILPGSPAEQAGIQNGDKLFNLMLTVRQLKSALSTLARLKLLRSFQRILKILVVTVLVWLWLRLARYGIQFILHPLKALPLPLA
jgi:regulator of sigma E protease